ncbi:MAG: LON peptidase substrate-binding domain-containing protein, partial [Anaerolineales bacterium]
MNDEQWFPPSDDENEIIGNLHQRTEELYRISNREIDLNGSFISPAFILNDVVVFPRMISPIFLSNEKSSLAVDAAQSQNLTVIALFLSDKGVKGDSLSEFLPIGMELAVGRLLSMQGGNHSALVQGRRRVEIINILETEPYLLVEVRPVPEKFRMTRTLTALMRTSRNLFEQCVELNESLPEEAQLFSMNINDPSWLADLIASSLSLPNETRKALMVVMHPADRLKQVNKILAEELDVLELEDEIQTQVQTEVDRSHREYYLREQMKAIQTELGEGDIWSQEIHNLSEKIEEK